MTKTAGVTARGTNWLELLDHLAAGDRLAFLKINRLLTQYLTQLRAYDLNNEWEDLRQEVVIALVQNHRAGKLRDPAAFLAYARSITRNKFYDRLARQDRLGEKTTVPIERIDLETLQTSPSANGDGVAREVWFAVDDLPEQPREILHGIYRGGMTYEQVAAATGIPLGTVKRRLRQALAALRHQFRDVL
jgi:RNA polymerase sigma-70 factor (ECF subfamily)